MDNKVRVIVNADDFGFSEGVNYGILKAHQQGVVTSTTIMANMPGFDHAICIAKQHPTLRVGVHLNVTCGKPVLKSHTTLIGTNGKFDRSKQAKFDEEEVYAELCAQIEKVLAAGIRVDHFDSHHHIHTEKQFQRVMERILMRYPYPIRGGFTYANKYPYQSTLCMDFYDAYVSLKDLSTVLQSFKPNKVYDLMCHPAYIDDILIDYSSYIIKRVEELRILCSEELQAEIDAFNMELVTYSCIS